MVNPVLLVAGVIALLLLSRRGAAEEPPSVEDGFGAQGFGSGPYGDPLQAMSDAADRMRGGDSLFDAAKPPGTA